jgi:hypothetical protein
MNVARSALFIVTTIATPLQAAAQSSHFFPIRPAHVTLKSMTGVLAAWGQGNDTAGLAIREPNGRLVQFFMGRNRKVNGRAYDCLMAPEPGKRRDYSACREWPSNIAVGHTVVRVDFWLQKAPWGEVVRVSDAISKA